MAKIPVEPSLARVLLAGAEASRPGAPDICSRAIRDLVAEANPFFSFSAGDVDCGGGQGIWGNVARCSTV